MSQDEKLIENFKVNRDVYSTIASLAFNLPYETCCEFHPVTGAQQPDGKARRSEAKKILLGITYGRSIPSIASQLYGDRTDMTEKEKVDGAQKIYDAVITAFPSIQEAMTASQDYATKHGYVETILGRRRHIADMQLPRFQYQALEGYVNPDIDPLNPATLKDKSEIPQRIIDGLNKELNGYKYAGQVYKRIHDLYDNHHIQVINNTAIRRKASRKCLNSVVQGSASDQTKLAILLLETSPEWKSIGGRLLVPIHDELLCEVPEIYSEEGGKLLSKLMCDAAAFLPFPSKCDVTKTYRWYGEEYPCPYPKPSSMDLENLSDEEIMWIQYMLREEEYLLPILPLSNGKMPKEGPPTRGINGVPTTEMEDAINDFLQKRKIPMDKFLDVIESEVGTGIIYPTNLI